MGCEWESGTEGESTEAESYEKRVLFKSWYTISSRSSLISLLAHFYLDNIEIFVKNWKLLVTGGVKITSDV